MKSLLPEKPRTNMLEDNLIPMINIIFLLLIFFMMAGQVSQLRNTQAVAIPLSKSTSTVTVQTIKVIVTSDQTIFVNDVQKSLDELDTALAKDPSENRTINLLADKALTAGGLEPVLAVIRKHNVSNIALLTSLTDGEAK